MKLFLLLIMSLLLCLAAFPAMAQDAAQVAPVWLGGVVAFLMGIPSVGPILVKILSVIGIVCAFFTALSTFLQAVLIIPEIGLKIAGAKGLSEKIKSFSDKVLPILKYLSIYNVQKK